MPLFTDSKPTPDILPKLLVTAFAKLDRRERLWPTLLAPSSPTFIAGSSMAVQSQLGGFSTMRFSRIGKDCAGAQVQIYRGYSGAAALEITWAPEVNPTGTQAIIVDYTFILARSGIAIGNSTVIQRTYAVPNPAVPQKDRIRINGIVPREDDILGIVITRRGDLAGDTYDSGNTSRFHVIQASFALKGSDGENV